MDGFQSQIFLLLGDKDNVRRHKITMGTDRQWVLYNFLV